MRTMTTMIAVATLGLALWLTPASGQTVTVLLSSPENGSVVEPGATIHWSIEFNVSSGDNLGLALLSVDLAQSDSNPARFDIPPASGVPAAMSNFSRPAGICNPGETDPTTGYTGVQRGTAGRRNLVQIGGAQNTFGQALPPGTGVAENASVVLGVGQSGNVLLASGSFPAPAATGTYNFLVRNIIANVITAVNPTFSSVTEATLSPASVTTFSFSVGQCNPADVNCDTAVDGRDIQAFVDILLQLQTPCSACAGNVDGLGGVTSEDVPAFVNALLTAP